MRNNEGQPQARQGFGRRHFSEQQTRQPLRGRFDLAVSAPPRAPDRPAPAPIPTQPRPEPAPQKAPEKPRRHTVRNIALAGTALGALGAGAYETYQNIPAVHQAVDSAFLDHLRGKSSPSEASASTEVFNPTAREGVIKPSMIERVPQGEIDKLDPFEKINDKNTVLAVYPIDVSTSDKPDAKMKYKKRNGGSGSDEDRIIRAKQGYLNSFYIENVPAGSTILSPVDGRLIVYKEILWKKDISINEDHPFGKAVIFFKPKEDEQYVMTIGGHSTKGGQMNTRGDVFKSLTDAPIYESGTSNMLKVIEQAIPVKKGQPILQVAMEVHVGFDLGDVTQAKRTITGTTVVDGKEMLVGQNAPSNLKLFLSEDGEIVQPHLPANP